MLEINFQFFGGRGSGGGKGGGGGADRGVAQSAVNRAAQEYVQHHLYNGETFGTVESAQIVSPVDKNGYADVKIEARKDVQIPIGRDIETGQMEYDYDVEYQTITTHLKVRR